MEEKKKEAVLAILKRVLDTYPEAWDSYRKLGETILDYAELVENETSRMKYAKWFRDSIRSIEDILRKENRSDLVEELRKMTDTLCNVGQLYEEGSKSINTVILITSEFLLAMEEIEDPE